MTGLISILITPWAQLLITLTIFAILSLSGRFCFSCRPVIVIALFALTALAVSRLILQAFPASGIEESFLIQGKIFASGHLWLEETPLAKFLFNKRMVVQEGKIVSQFTPGYPLMLAAFYILHIPDWILNPLLGTLSLLIFSAILSRMQLKQEYALAALGFTPFFLFNAGSYFSHTAGTLFALITFYCYLRLKERVCWAILLGLSVSIAVAIRPYTGLFISAPVILMVAFRNRSLLTPVVLGGLPVSLLLAAYNYAVTGDPLIDPFSWRYFEGNPVKALKVNQDSAPRIIEKLMVMAIWANPLLVSLGIWKIASRLLHRTTALPDLIFLSLTFGYFFFPDHAGNQYGPRYLLEAFPFLIIGVAIPSDKLTPDLERKLFQSIIVALFVLLPAFMILVKRPVDQRLVLRSLVLQSVEKDSVAILKGPPVQVVSIADLAQNSITLDDPVLFAWDAGEENCQFKRVYPGRRIYLIEFKERITDFKKSIICE